MAKKPIKKDVLKIVQQFGALVEKKIPVEQVILFGSQAKGTTHEWSDIDVCIVSPQFGENFFEEQLELDRYADTISTKIQPTPMNSVMLQNKFSTLATEIRKYGIVVKI